MRTYQARLSCPACPGDQPRDGRTLVNVTVSDAWDIHFECLICGWQWTTLPSAPGAHRGA